MKIKDYINRNGLESIAVLLSSLYEFPAYDIYMSILQLNSIDDTLVMIKGAKEHNLTLDQAVYLRLKGRDEKVGNK